MFAMASQRVHRGTNLPPGKSKKNSATKTVPSISTPRTGNHQAGWEETREFAAVGSTVTVPNVTRNNEVSSATRSSERRQKMSAPTANHTSLEDLVDDDVRDRVGAYRQPHVLQRPHAFWRGLTHRPLGTHPGRGGAHARIVLVAARNAEDHDRQRRTRHHHPRHAGQK